MHHRKNRSAGGLWDAANIVALHGDGVTGCHGFVTVNPEAAHAEGWHVQPWEDPAKVPVLWRGTDRVYLDQFGGMVPAPVLPMPGV